MSFIAGIGALVIDFFKTLIIDTFIKIILKPQDCIVSPIKIGGALIES